MGNVSGKLTVYFEKPFWVGVFERTEEGKLFAAKVTFGAEPKDYEVYEFILKCYYSLQFSPAVVTVVKEMRKNPKRVQRDVKNQLRGVARDTAPNKYWCCRLWSILHISAHSSKESQGAYIQIWLTLFFYCE